MEKTRVDDILIEMISPKIKEIEEKFSQGGSLTQDDINTLLLKAQYNHINHLDQKLDEVTQSVVNLEHKFDLTVKELRSDFKNLEQKMEATIQKALNKNMMMLIVVIGAFLTLSKIIDKF